MNLYVKYVIVIFMIRLYVGSFLVVLKLMIYGDVVIYRFVSRVRLNVKCVIVDLVVWLKLVCRVNKLGC